MKHFYTFIALVVFATTAFGQSTRTVLVEEGTNASCGPCAAQNPSFNALLDDNVGTVVSIKYQWYFPGFDPMHEHNPEEANARLSYYGINGVPTATIDGVIPDVSPSYAGAPGAFTQSLFDDAAAIPGSFDIEVTYELTPNGLTMDATATCTQAASGDLRFRIAVIEEEILFDTPPGSNGETEFYGVMKKFLPGVDGLTMADSYEVGETFSTSQSWTYANVYNVNELAVVVFIQNDDNKEVLQAAMASGAEVQPEFPNDVSGTDLGGVLPEGCSSTINPVVTIRNNGSETLESATINYSINDTEGSVEWTGSLEFFEAEDVELGEITFTPEDENTLEVSVTDPNGEMDMDPGNNEINGDVEVAPTAGTDIEVVVQTDNYGEETYWRLVDEDDNVIAEGGNSWVGTTNTGVGSGAPTQGDGTYNSQTLYEVPVEIPAGVECYKFEIYDYWGDGICCSWGSGFYEVVDVAAGEILFSGGTFEASDEKSFSAGVLSTTDNSQVKEFTLFPNPTVDQLNVEFTLAKSQRTSIDVYDVTGRLVFSKDYGVLPAGYSLQRLDLSQQGEGLYLLNINTESGMTVGKFTVNR